MKKYIIGIYIFLVSPVVYAQTGKVGINTTIPTAMLHVKDSSVLFTGPISIPSNPGSPPVSGIGTRMMWYSNRGAFRSGYADGVNWDKDSTGIYSFATGFDTKAKGEEAFATGFRTNASGGFSFAAGFITSAEAQRSVTFGSHTISRFNDCMVVGTFNDTSSIPFSSVYTPTLFVVANGTAANNRRNAFTVATNGRVGIGTANPRAALQIFNQDPQDQHLALTSFFSINDTAFIKYDDRRVQFRNTGNFGSFWDFQNKSGITKCIISSDGDIDMAGGWTTGGACGINTPDKLAGLHIKAINGTFDQHIRLESTIGPASYANILYDGILKFRTFDATASFQWRDNTNDTRMLLTSAGNLTIDGVLTQNSDARLKQNIKPLQNSLQKLLLLSGYQYHWIAASRDKALQTGLIAQEVEQQMPELVLTDEEGVKSLNYIGMIPYLIEGMKELKKENQLLKEEIKKIKANRQ
jgi:hypothetical protein